MRWDQPLLPGNSNSMRGEGLKLYQGSFQGRCKETFILPKSSAAVAQLSRSGGVTNPGGVPGLWRCGSEGRGQWARLGWAEVGLGDLRGLFQPECSMYG